MLILLIISGMNLNPFVAQPSAMDQAVYGIGQVALVTYALRPNIGRLRRGEERRVEY